MKKTFFVLVMAGLVAVSAFAKSVEPTAFALIKEGNRHVGEDTKDKVSQIRSEKSVGSLVPTIWYVVFYDRDAAAKATQVKFAAGKKIDVKRPSRILELGSSKFRELDRSKMKIDSDKAIEIATKDSTLSNVTVTNTRLWLEGARNQDTPVWKVRLWAAKVRKPTETVDIGELYISAEDGKIVKNHLKIHRVD